MWYDSVVSTVFRGLWYNACGPKYRHRLRTFRRQVSRHSEGILMAIIDYPCNVTLFPSVPSTRVLNQLCLPIAASKTKASHYICDSRIHIDCPLV